MWNYRVPCSRIRDSKDSILYAGENSSLIAKQKNEGGEKLAEKDLLLGLGEPSRDVVPTHNLPPLVDVFSPVVGIVQIICVFPYVEA